jgi:hypothetical protein
MPLCRSGSQRKRHFRVAELPVGPGVDGGDDLGHNVACITVGADGKITDFDFNHIQVLQQCGGAC